MKKLGIALILSVLVVAGCTSTPKKKKSSSTVDPTSQTSVDPTSETPTTTAAPTSVSITSNTTAPTSASAISHTSSPTSNPSSSSSDIPSSSSGSTPTPVVELQKISTIKAEHKVGALVSFQATYLRKITMNNDAVLFFADETGYIGFRCTTQSDYINNTYRFRECKVTGKLTQTENAYELAYDSSFGTLNDSVVRLGDTTPLSYDEYNTTLPTQLTSIHQIEEKSALLVQDNKSNAYGEIVRFTAQYANYEDDNSKQKCMFTDNAGESIVIIQDNDAVGGHRLTPLMEVDNIGKWYELTGVISIKSSIPAILAWTCTYVSKTTEEETSFDVSNATEVTTEVSTKIFKGNLTSDKFSPLENQDYFYLYHAQGWVYDDGVSAGFTLVEGGTIPVDGKNTRKGFYFVNGTKYSFDEFAGSKIDIWFKIESYNTSHHIWKIFLIESLLPQVY